MDFEKHGFKTGKVVLPGIDLQVTLPKNHYFRNDKIVENIESHTTKILEDMNISSKFDKDYGLRFGRCLTITEYDAIASTVCILNVSPAANLCNYGHESTHAIMHLGLENQFVDMLRYEGFSLNPFNRYDDEESIANVGGLIALYRNYIINFEITTDTVLAPIYRELFASKKPDISYFTL